MITKLNNANITSTNGAQNISLTTRDTGNILNVTMICILKLTYYSLINPTVVEECRRLTDSSSYWIANTPKRLTSMLQALSVNH